MMIGKQLKKWDFSIFRLPYAVGGTAAMAVALGK
jgi:hypothetical protein